MLGDNIKKFREDLKISQRELGRRINKTGQFISLVEQGKSNPSVEVLNKISNELGVSIDELIKDSDLINLTTTDKETREMYTDFLSSDPHFSGILKAIESSGYKVIQNTINYEVSILKDKSVVATIPENEFIEQGKELLKHINEFTQFEVNKLIDCLNFLYAEPIEKD